MVIGLRVCTKASEGTSSNKQSARYRRFIFIDLLRRPTDAVRLFLASVMFLALLCIWLLHRSRPSARGQLAGGLRATTPTPSSGVSHDWGLTGTFSFLCPRAPVRPLWSRKSGESIVKQFLKHYTRCHRWLHRCREGLPPICWPARYTGG